MFWLLFKPHLDLVDICSTNPGGALFFQNFSISDIEIFEVLFWKYIFWFLSWCKGQWSWVDENRVGVLDIAIFRGGGLPGWVGQKSMFEFRVCVLCIMYSFACRIQWSGFRFMAMVSFHFFVGGWVCSFMQAGGLRHSVVRKQSFFKSVHFSFKLWEVWSPLVCDVGNRVVWRRWPRYYDDSPPCMFFQRLLMRSSLYLVWSLPPLVSYPNRLHQMIDHDIVHRWISCIAQACSFIITVPSEEPWSLDTPVFFIVVYLMNDGGYTATQDIQIKLITYVND